MRSRPGAMMENTESDKMQESIANGLTEHVVHRSQVRTFGIYREYSISRLIDKRVLYFQPPLCETHLWHIVTCVDIYFSENYTYQRVVPSRGTFNEQNCETLLDVSPTRTRDVFLIAAIVDSTILPFAYYDHDLLLINNENIDQGSWWSTTLCNALWFDLLWQGVETLN